MKTKAEVEYLPADDLGEQRIVLPVPPSANRYWRHSWSGAVYVSQEAKEYKLLVRFMSVDAGVTCVPGEVELGIVLYRDRNIGDVDNYLKVLLDALQGCLYINDRQVRSISITKFIDKKNPRVEVVMRPWMNGLGGQE